MSFVSFEFFLFSLAVFPLYFLLAQRYRWALLLVSSLVFFAYGNGAYVLLLLATTLFDFQVARWLEQTADPRRRRLLLAGSLLLNFGILFFFKYFNFVIGSVGDVARAVGMDMNVPYLSLILPIGISFYTFQEAGYMIDVYRRRIPAERSAGIFTTFVVFFPQLVAGPILRAPDLLPQFRQRFAFDATRIVEGLRLILWGVFKKVVIADRLAVYVNAVYAQPQAHAGGALLVATIFFAFQIYCDFSGYTDIAIGLAKIMGFTLMPNFRQPYFSASVREFWSRWHISLSTWFRDYLYIPLGGNRVPFARNLLNLLIVFLVSGLWHGANWTFVIWGLLHGVVVVLETILARAGWVSDRRAWQTLPKIALTFAIVTAAWVFFRATSVNDALYILREILNFRAYAPADMLLYLGDEPGIALLFQITGINFTEQRGIIAAFALNWALIGGLLVYDYLDARDGIATRLHRVPVPIRWAYYYGITAALVILGFWGLQSFIYFQF